MGAYNKIRGQHACHNDFTLHKILKDDWKFAGCVITDWGGAHDTYEAAVNGLDIEMEMCIRDRMKTRSELLNVSIRWSRKNRNTSQRVAVLA